MKLKITDLILQLHIPMANQLNLSLVTVKVMYQAK